MIRSKYNKSKTFIPRIPYIYTALIAMKLAVIWYLSKIEYFNTLDELIIILVGIGVTGFVMFLLSVRLCEKIALTCYEDLQTTYGKGVSLLLLALSVSDMVGSGLMIFILIFMTSYQEILLYITVFEIFLLISYLVMRKRRGHTYEC